MKILQIDSADDCTTGNLLKATEFCPRLNFLVYEL